MVISQSRRAGFFAELTTTLRHLKKINFPLLVLFSAWLVGSTNGGKQYIKYIGRFLTLL